MQTIPSRGSEVPLPFGGEEVLRIPGMVFFFLRERDQVNIMPSGISILCIVFSPVCQFFATKNSFWQMLTTGFFFQLHSSWSVVRLWCLVRFWVIARKFWIKFSQTMSGVRGSCSNWIIGNAIDINSIENSDNNWFSIPWLRSERVSPKPPFWNSNIRFHARLEEEREWDRTVKISQC